MNPLVEKIYFSSPIFLQNIMVSAYGYKLYRQRYVGNHGSYLQSLLKSQWYNKEQMRDLREKRFRAIVEHAIKNVPFYRDWARVQGVKPNDISQLSDLPKLPIIHKEDVRENLMYFLAEGFRKTDLIVINTSGTTGKTLKIYVDKDSRRHAYAFFSRFKMWAGINGKPSNVTLAGRTIVPSDAKRPPFWRKNAVMNNFLFSSYHLSAKNLEYYVDKLREIQPKFINSYPSGIYTIARYMKENGLSGIHPTAVITSAETLFDYQREMIEEVFQCPVYDQYGCAEQVIFVSQCERGTYHIHPEYGIVEFLRNDGTRAAPGEPARLICTGFTNRAMPLIRYDIGDTAAYSEGSCGCGRKFPLIERIIGRTDDMIVTSDGRQVGRLDPVFKGLGFIKEAQLVQEDYDYLVVRIVPGKNYNERDGKIVAQELKKRLGSQVQVHITTVDEIPREPNGKLRAVVSKVKH